MKRSHTDTTIPEGQRNGANVAIEREEKRMKGSQETFIACHRTKEDDRQTNGDNNAVPEKDATIHRDEPEDLSNSPRTQNAPPPPLPLLNRKNYCFINAIIQILYHNKHLLRCILDGVEEVMKEKGSANLPQNLRLWTQSLLLYQTYFEKSRQQRDQVTLDFHILRSCFACRSDKSQEDASDILCVLFNALPKRHLIPMKKTFRMHATHQIHPITPDSRQRYSTSQAALNESGEIEYFFERTELFWCIHLSLPAEATDLRPQRDSVVITRASPVLHRYSLEGLIQNYANSELMNPYECKAFDESSSTTSDSTLRTFNVYRETHEWSDTIAQDPPKTIIISYKRFLFDGTRTTKRSNPVDAPLCFDLVPFFNKNITSTFHYRLKAYLTHTGTELDVGHYTATLKTESGIYLCNDRKIQVQSEFHKEQIANAYVLFYERVAKGR